jgi:hypothetical protein
MGTYGRNFEFRITPTEEQRHGRVLFAGATPVPIGVPLVVADNAVPDAAWTEALPATLATGAQPFDHGQCGIGVYEHIDINGSATTRAESWSREWAPRRPYGSATYSPRGPAMTLPVTGLSMPLRPMPGCG